MWRKTNGGTTGVSAAGISGFEYPNTNAYQYGIVAQTFVKIYDIQFSSFINPFNYDYEFKFVREAGPTGSCANVDCNQGSLPRASRIKPQANILLSLPTLLLVISRD